MAFKQFLLFGLLGLVYLSSSTSGQTQTLYQYFTEGGITEGLRADNRQYFILNGKPLKIFSGSLHYFRVHPDQWRDRLRKFRAAGLNTVDVYVPWNLHEPEKGVFDFGNGNRDFSPFLDLRAFVTMAMEEDLFVIFRPGPYICGEWEFGGLPSWLLGEEEMFVRRSHQVYEERARIYLEQVIAQVVDLQFYTASGNRGGPIIMAQIENEYGNFGYTDWPRDIDHLRFLKGVMTSNGIESLLFTSDSPAEKLDWGNVDNVLMTANFRWNSEDNLQALVELQPNKPVLVTEYWPGWFDHWFEPFHNTLPVDEFEVILNNIFSYDGSVNFYMFHGGTNFGFMNGANVLDSDGTSVAPHYAVTVTSYDYNAPLSECGNYTAKYDKAAEMIAAYDPLASVLTKPARPTFVPPVSYPTVIFSEFMDYDSIVNSVPSTKRETSTDLLSMEQLSINNGNGQSYGYIIYRKVMRITNPAVTFKVRGHVRDMLQVIVNGQMVNDPILTRLDLSNFGSYGPLDAEFVLDILSLPIPNGQVTACDPSCTIDFMVENTGRANYGRPHEFDQKKGLWQDVLMDGQSLKDWEIFAMEFDGAFLTNLNSWAPYIRQDHLEYSPRVLRGTLTIDEAIPADTFFDLDCSPKCEEWLHGIVFVNGFNIGRYFQVGPQKTLYIPGPLLQTGSNEIIVMDNYLGSDEMQFTNLPNYGPVKQEG